MHYVDHKFQYWVQVLSMVPQGRSKTSNTHFWWSLTNINNRTYNINCFLHSCSQSQYFGSLSSILVQQAWIYVYYLARFFLMHWAPSEYPHPLPILYGISATGTKLCFFEFNKQLGSVTPPQIPKHPLFAVTTTPVDWWDCDVLKAATVGRTYHHWMWGTWKWTWINVAALLYQHSCIFSHIISMDHFT